MSVSTKSKIREFALVYIRFLRQPVREIRSLPDWSWNDLILNQIALTAAMGALAGLLKTSVLSLFHGILLVPILTSITILAASFFFYFVFQALGGVTLHFRRILELLFFANIPFFILQTIAHWIPLVSLLGLTIAAVLLVVGFTDNFMLNRKFVLKVVGGVYALILLVGIWSRLDAMRFESRFDKPAEAPPVELGR